jgi:hypothetical protein
MARLVVDTKFRDRVRACVDDALDCELTPLERKRLQAIASDSGLAATSTLYRGFRLSKLYAMLPRTCALLGKRRLTHEVRLYWAARISVSLYFFEEAFGFCDHLQARLQAGLRVAYLEEVMTYERACLELQRPRADTDAPTAQLVKFQHDPEILLNYLSRGQKPRAVPALSCTLLGVLDENDKVQWHLLEDKAKPRKRRSPAKHPSTTEPRSHRE